jgi:hypothetical protein
MDRYGGPKTALAIALLGGLYLAIIMDRYGGPQCTQTLLFVVLYLAIIMDRYGGPHTALSIALLGAFT